MQTPSPALAAGRTLPRSALAAIWGAIAGCAMLAYMLTASALHVHMAPSGTIIVTNMFALRWAAGGSTSRLPWAALWMVSVGAGLAGLEFALVHYDIFPRLAGR